MQTMRGISPVRFIWLLSLIASAVILVAFGPLNAPLQTAAAPLGMISFELARTEANAASMLGSWDEAARLAAAFSLGLDYLFLVSYATAIGMVCWAVAARHEGRWATLGRLLAWGLLLAALLDAVENLALWQQLQHGAGASLARLAWLAALAKFALVAAGLLYALGGLISWRRR